ncbi:MAG: NAD(+) synthase [Oligoflexia bacterium]|nr:NAD(+) synthase [Oligoflexia bacterium]
MNYYNLQLRLHQTHQRLADLSAIFNYLKDTIEQSQPQSESQQQQLQLHLFPELFLCGYPLQDLVLQRSFIDAYLEHLQQINRWSCSLPQHAHSNFSNLAILLGGLFYKFDLGSSGGKERVPSAIYNEMFLLQPGKELVPLYAKMLLPNYDIFDERKYFTPGEHAVIWEWQGLQIALTICEDMWPSCTYPVNPIAELKQLSQALQAKQRKIDFIVNISASPYYLGKFEMRLSRARQISHALGAPMFYVNKVGGEDEILFDGQSFIVNGDQILAQAQPFAAEVLNFETPLPLHLPIPSPIISSFSKENSWESLFVPAIVASPAAPSAVPSLLPWSDDDCADVLEALKFGLLEYVNKVAGKRLLVAVSGGIDSALVLTIIKLALEQFSHLEVEAIFMPSQYTSGLSADLAQELCNTLRVKLFHLPIKFLHSAVRNLYQDVFKQQLSGLSNENIQSRLRGALLYARANQWDALVINTSNKSELAVGYSTLYGDSVGAISLLGDIYKTEVYTLSSYLNKVYPRLIPTEIINRPPSAELRENQTDQSSLPPYSRLDVIIEGIISYHLSPKDLIAMGLPEEDVYKTFRLYHGAEFKRKQFPPIIKIKRKSFGFGHRVPITKNGDFYFK